MRRFLILPFAVALCLAQTKPAPAPKQQHDDAGVREAIAYQRAKDRADAEQARKQRLHPENFTYAAPRKTGDDQDLAARQRREALEHSADRVENQK